MFTYCFIVFACIYKWIYLGFVSASQILLIIISTSLLSSVFDIFGHPDKLSNIIASIDTAMHCLSMSLNIYIFAIILLPISLRLSYILILLLLSIIHFLPYLNHIIDWFNNVYEGNVYISELSDLIFISVFSRCSLQRVSQDPWIETSRISECHFSVLPWSLVLRCRCKTSSSMFHDTWLTTHFPLFLSVSNNQC
jgi:hypothetical protein